MWEEDQEFGYSIQKCPYDVYKYIFKFLSFWEILEFCGSTRESLESNISPKMMTGALLASPRGFVDASISKFTFLRRNYYEIVITKIKFLAKGFSWEFKYSYIQINTESIDKKYFHNSNKSVLNNCEIEEAFIFSLRKNSFLPKILRIPLIKSGNTGIKSNCKKSWDQKARVSKKSKLKKSKFWV